MKTLRLRTLQQPAHVERLLEAFVSRGNFLPQGAYQVRDPDASATNVYSRLKELPSGCQLLWGCLACNSGVRLNG